MLIIHLTENSGKTGKREISRPNRQGKVFGGSQKQEHVGRFVRTKFSAGFYTTTKLFQKLQ